ncbi:MAG: ribonuclease III domain-containing protein [Candidatus Saccharibacteria bacterium]
MDTNAYQQLAIDKLGGEFGQLDLLITALTHRSYVNEHRSTVKEHNERLEFLGDAVLELVVTEFLYANYSEPEGILTNWRSSLVRTESIGAAATRLGFEPLLRLSRGEKRGTERARAQILANSFEAVTGAIYLDKGWEAAKAFITENILSTFDGILKSGSWMDPRAICRKSSRARAVPRHSTKYTAKTAPTTTDVRSRRLCRQRPQRRRHRPQQTGRPGRCRHGSPHEVPVSFISAVSLEAVGLWRHRL